MENQSALNYNITIYHSTNDDSSRFLLGTTGKKPLIGIGINPSKANKIRSDNTVSKVIGFARKYKYDSWIMLNLYPQRATNPIDLDYNIDKNLHSENVKVIAELISQYKSPHLLAAWGALIESRPFFNKCLLDIVEAMNPYKTKWLKIGDELTKSGHPRHPSRSGYDMGLSEFNMKKYIKSL